MTEVQGRSVVMMPGTAGPETTSKVRIIRRARRPPGLAGTPKLALTSSASTPARKPCGHVAEPPALLSAPMVARLNPGLLSRVGSSPITGALRLWRRRSLLLVP